MADARDLKSRDRKTSCGFESHHRHELNRAEWRVSLNFCGRQRPIHVLTKKFLRASLLIRSLKASLIVVILLAAPALFAGAVESPAPWKTSPFTNDNFFPVAVWLQNPANAARFKAAGINLYVGLHNGPTSNQIASLRKAGVQVICGQRRGLVFKDDPTIIGWMHGDEPDNAQSLGTGKGYGPPILPSKIVADYERIRAADPARPVLLNLGQGVAWDNYIGRGVRRNHPEDYPEYVKGCDIASFDIYPAVHDHVDVAGKLEFVARGVERLRDWAGPERAIWNCIECTRISNTKTKPTPAQVRTEVWMSLIHGSRGLIYFVHQFKPVFREAALLDDPEMLAAVTTLNRQIQQLAPVLNSSSITNGLIVKSFNADAPIAWMMKERAGVRYVFAVNMRDLPTRAAFNIRGVPASRAEVLGEPRQLEVTNGEWNDDFAGYAVHLYKLGTTR
jgi:hypothetical protein